MKREELPWSVDCPHCGRKAMGYLPYRDPENEYREIAETVCRHCGASDILIYDHLCFVNGEPWLKRIYWPPVRSKTPRIKRDQVDDEGWHF